MTAWVKSRCQHTSERLARCIWSAEVRCSRSPSTTSQRQKHGANYKKHRAGTGCV